MGADFGNSFLVLAGKGAPSTFWPDDRLAACYSTSRRPELSTETLVTTSENGVRFDRRTLVDGRHQVGSIRLVASVADYEPGRDVLDVVGDGGLSAAQPLITAWLELLHVEAGKSEHVPMDLVPHNLVVDDDGGIRVIGLELVDDAMSVDAIIRRGVLWLANRVTRVAPPERFPPHRTVRDVTIALGRFAGLPDDGSWIDRALDEEVEVAMCVRTGPPTGTTMHQWRDRIRSDFETILDRKLTGLPVGERLWETHQRKITAFAGAAKRKDRSGDQARTRPRADESQPGQDQARARQGQEHAGEVVDASEATARTHGQGSPAPNGRQAPATRHPTSRVREFALSVYRRIR